MDPAQPYASHYSNRLGRLTAHSNGRLNEQVHRSSHKVLTIGSALVDIFISSDQFTISHGDEEVFTTRSQGGKLSVDSFKIKTGGGGGNTAAGFAKFDFDVGCVAELGVDELAELVLNDLRRHNVKTNYLIQERKEETGGSVLLVSANGERTALVHRGAAAMLDPHDIDEGVLSQQDWIHLSSVAGRINTIQTVFKIAYDRKIPISWNPGLAELQALAEMAHVDSHTQQEQERQIAYFQTHSHPVSILLLNKQEWELILPVQEMLKSVIPCIVVTDSIRGGIVFEKDVAKPHAYQAMKVDSVDNTGAGDAFAVGFVSAMIRELPLETAIKWGVRNAASVVQTPGAKNGLLSLEDLHNSDQDSNQDFNQNFKQENSQKDLNE